MVNLYVNQAIVILDDHKFSIFPPKIPLEMLYRKSVKFSVSVGIIITSIIFIIPILILLGFQIRTNCCESNSVVIRRNLLQIKSAILII